MDIVTQGLAGAVLAQSFSKQHETRMAMGIGFLAGLLADIDALFTQSETDPLLQLDFHRHFTHSLFFIPAGGLIAALLMWPVLKKHLPFKRLLVFTTAGYGTSGLIDACTSYGTSLLWPLSDERISWNIISILDPLFSIALIAAILFAAVKRTPRYAVFGICFAISYLLVGFAQHERVEAMAMAAAEARGHHVERIEIKPTMGNLILWRSIYEADGHFYVDAFRAGLDEEKIYQGESTKRFELADLPQLSRDSVVAEDIKRFDFFSDGYIALHQSDDVSIIGDIRYSMLPTSAKPIWGIELDLSDQQKHTPFNQFHDASDVTRQAFIDMLLGEDVRVVLEGVSDDPRVMTELPEKQI
ncbi:inner membrane protein [Mariprofundus ferrinatatus]|uniref:Inner membrane protein n=1 Tax=Mariprofundus ferrinatatus TaxID=1921087 RepID=A0A2K8L272_9PROT|nr:metal-dependent hydrolase [Mariprofundus ferrinatatus]ATX81387.1 inner membrane protein [Mariprofundus ferrinatatus]